MNAGEIRAAAGPTRRRILLRAARAALRLARQERDVFCSRAGYVLWLENARMYRATARHVVAPPEVAIRMAECRTGRAIP